MKLTQTTFLLGCVVGGMGAAIVPLLLPTSRADIRLLPFQGRLTDATGAVITTESKVVEFKIYDAPTGGAVKWAGEVHKLSVNGGLVNTLLGSKASLDSVDFSTPSYLQITIDANDDRQITAADPPLLPRQSVQPSVYAAVAGRMQYKVSDGGSNLGHVAAKGWEAVFDNGNPETGRISAAKLADSSITSQQLNAGAVTSEKVLDGSIQSQDLSPSLREGITPVGTISAYILDTPPAGWLMCDGHEELASDYPALAAAVQSKFGQASPPDSGGGVKFKLPDLRGVFLRGRNAGRNDFLADSKAGERLSSTLLNATIAGDKVGSVQDDAVGSHGHDIGGQDNRGIVITGINFTVGPNVATSVYRYSGNQTFANPGDSDTFKALPSAGMETHPPNISVNYIIKF